MFLKFGLLFSLYQSSIVWKSGSALWGTSGIFFLLYILPVGQIIKHYNNISYHRYADEILLLCSFKAS